MVLFLSGANGGSKPRCSFVTTARGIDKSVLCLNFILGPTLGRRLLFGPSRLRITKHWCRLGPASSEKNSMMQQWQMWMEFLMEATTEKDLVLTKDEDRLIRAMNDTVAVAHAELHMHPFACLEGHGIQFLGID
ncbi:hypothetical protein V6N13_084408 [Hibiscus sabdariffa]